jgi:hypothetical protein
MRIWCYFLKGKIARAIYAAYVADDNRQSDEAEIIHFNHEPFEKLDSVDMRLINDQAQAALEAMLSEGPTFAMIEAAESELCCGASSCAEKSFIAAIKAAIAEG